MITIDSPSTMQISVRYHNELGPMKDQYRNPATGEWFDRAGYDQALEWFDRIGQYLGYYRAVLHHAGKQLSIESPRFYKDDRELDTLSTYPPRWKAYEDLMDMIKESSFKKLQP